MIKKRPTREIKIGNLILGGDNPIRVQSMTSTRTEDIKATLKQIYELVNAGCEMVRVAVEKNSSIEALKSIRKEIDVPLIADIHYNYRLAIKAMEVGCNKIRINPGNIGAIHRVKEVINAAKANGVPLRIGVNAGSLEPDLIDQYGGVTPEALVESAVRWIRIFEEENFPHLVVSVKSASVPQTIVAYRELSEKIDYPLHLGVTEAGPPGWGTIKSVIGIGTLLADGIGDTIRVSLTGDPVEEVQVAWNILKALELRARGPLLISCPTCSRVRVDMVSLVREVEKRLNGIKTPLRIAIMGCEVNGPGEAKDADLGVAGAPGMGWIFRKGRLVRKVKEEEITDALLEELKQLEEMHG